MQTAIKVNLFDMILNLSNAIDLVNPIVHNHHNRVAYMSHRLAIEMGCSTEVQDRLMMAGALHDIGALFLSEHNRDLAFETLAPGLHAYLSSIFLKKFEPFKHIAPIVCGHHTDWNYGLGVMPDGSNITVEGNILHLADTLDALIIRDQEILGQVPGIIEQIVSLSGGRFNPEIVDAFRRLAKKEHFWFEVTAPYLSSLVRDTSLVRAKELELADLEILSKMFSQIIDFRSRFTAVHSCGVANIAQTLARIIGWSHEECRMIKIAGYLHDLGKLAVPTEILEKPGALTEYEYNVVKSHPYHTYRILSSVPELKYITDWACMHHERPNGQGYPFHRTEINLALGAKIMTVADIFTAVTEDRPYRAGMPKDQLLALFNRLAHESALDARLVALVEANYHLLIPVCVKAQQEAIEEYEAFRITMSELTAGIQ